MSVCSGLKNSFVLLSFFTVYKCKCINKLCSVVLRKVHNKIVCFHKRIFKSNKSLSTKKKDGLLSEILDQLWGWLRGKSAHKPESLSSVPDPKRKERLSCPWLSSDPHTHAPTCVRALSHSQLTCTQENTQIITIKYNFKVECDDTYLPLIPAFIKQISGRSQRIQGQPDLHAKFQNSQGYAGKNPLSNKKTKV